MLVIITNEEEAQALRDLRKRNKKGYKTGTLSLRPDAHAVKVLIVEVGYSSELRYKEKIQAKMDHRKTAPASSEQCWISVQDFTCTSGNHKGCLQ